MDNRPRSPLLVTVNVTGRCNLKCSYCYFQPRAQTDMSMADYRAVLAALQEEEIFLLTLSGGESFMHPNAGELFLLAHESFEHVSVLTNGTVLGNPHLRAIREIVDRKGFFPLQVSTDSLDAAINDKTRGRTATLRKNLHRLRDAGATITIAIVISALNVNRLRETIESLLDVTRHFHVMPVKAVPFLEGQDSYLQVLPARMKEAWDELISLRTEFGIHVRTPVDDLCTRMETSATGAPCMAGFTKLAIDPNLDVRPCDKCVSTVVGNLRDQTLGEIWEGERLANIYQRSTPYCAMPPVVTSQRVQVYPVAVEA